MKRFSWLLVIGGGLLIALLLASSFVSPFILGRSFVGYRYGWGMMGGFGFPMTLAPHARAGVGMMGFGMLLYWVLILGGVIWFVQTLTRGAGNRSISPQAESAFDILQRRYSQGEITKEEYDGMKRELEL